MAYLILLQFFIISSAQLTNNQYQLDSQNLQYQQTLLYDPIFQSMFSFNTQYGIWSQYIPASQVKSIGLVQQSDCAILHYVVNEQNTQTFFYYVCFDKLQKKITHSVQFICDNQQYQQSLSFEGDLYEGQWIYFHLTASPSQAQFVITILLIDGDKYTYQTYNHKFPFSPGTNIMYFGSTVIVTNPTFQNINNFMSFRGKIILYKVEISPPLPIIYYSYDYVKSLANYYNSQLFQSCYAPGYNQPLDDVLQSKKQIVQINVQLEEYQFSGWFKLRNKLATDLEYDIIYVSPSYSLIGQEEFFSAITTKLKYLQTSDGTQQFHFHTYSLTMPILNVDSIVSIDDIIQSPFSLQQWHFVTIYLNQNTLKLKIYNYPNLIQRVYTVTQFTHYELKSTIGAQLNGNTLQIAHVLLENCPSSETEVICHYNCLECSGPTFLDCESCDPNQHKELKYSQCVCQLGYYGTSVCRSNNELELQLVERYDLVLDEQFCPVGYRFYQNECIKCPGVRTHYYIHCIECLGILWIFQQDWLVEPKCITTLSVIDNQEGNAFQKQQSLSDLYLISFNELIFCEYCYKLCSNPSICQKYKGIDVENPYYVECDHYSIMIDGLCQRKNRHQIKSPQISNQDNCAYYSISYCAQCIDSKKYYRSLLNPFQCLPCIIENCQYCFEYSLVNRNINSFSITGSYDYSDDIVISCALCDDGFTLNMQTNKCEYLVPISPCTRQLVDENNQIICLISSQMYPFGNAIQYSQCQDYILDCQQCIDDNGQMRCVLCKDGYKVDKFTQQCVQCRNFQIKSCAETDLNYQDQYILYFQSFYYYFIGSLYETKQSPYMYDFPLSCYEGYEISFLSCINSCEPSDTCQQCGIIKNNFVYSCFKCQSSQQGYQIQQVDFGDSTPATQCLSCPYLCNFCLIDDNNEFVGCLLKEQTDQLTYIDNKLKIVHFCKYEGKCIKQVIKTFELNCIQRDLLFASSIPTDGQNTRYSAYEYGYQQYGQIIALQKFTYHFHIIEDLDCPSQEFIIINGISFSFNNEIRSLQEIEFILKADDYYKIELKLTNIQFEELVTFIQMEKLIALVNPFFSFIKLNYDQDIQSTYLFKDMIFQGKCEECSIVFQLGNLEQVDYIDIVFQNLYIKNQEIIQLSQYNIELSYINLFNVTFINCYFEDTILLKYYNKMELNLQQISFINCTLIKFYLLTSSIQEQNILIQLRDIYIDNTILDNSTLFLLTPYSNTQISNFTIYNSLINNSVIFEISNSIQLFGLYFNSNQIINSQIMHSNFQVTIPNLIFTISDIKFISNYFIQSKIMIFYFKEDQTASINIDNIYHHNQTHKNEIDSNINVLYEFKNYFYNPKSVIEDQFQININKFVVQQIQTSQLSLWQECSDTNTITNLIQIFGFSHISITNSLFNKLQIIDKQIIDINLEQVQSLQGILLKNITFQENLLTKVSEGIQLGFIQIQSKLNIQITFQDVKFINNLINFYIQDTYITPACFIIISSYLSSITLQDIFLEENFISNSSTTYFSINAKSVNFINIQSIKNNYKDLTNLVNLDFNGEQAIRQKLIQQQFTVLSDPGIAIITSQFVSIYDSQFIDGYSYSTNIFKIIGKQNCTVIMQNIQIQNQTSNMEEIPQIYGCFFIDSQQSILNLQIEDVELNHLTNRMESAFIYVKSSLYSNHILINNITIKNIFSLKNALISLDQSNSFSSLNQIVINNLFLINEEQSFTQFLKNLRFITKDISNTGLIYINKGKNINLVNLTIAGYFNTKILQLVDAERIILNKIRFNNIQTLQSIMELSVTGLLQLLQCNFYNIQQIAVENSDQPHEDGTLEFYDLSGQQDCSLVIRQNLQEIFSNNQHKENLFNQNQLLQAIQEQPNGLIQIQTEDSINIYISDIEFFNSSSNNSLIYFKANSQSLIQFSKCKFSNNKIGNGTINILSEHPNTIVTIKDSRFEDNSCNFGCSIYATNIKFTLLTSQFLSNQAELSAGGIYISSTLQMTILKSSFLNNYAKLGGAILIHGVKLSKENIENLTLSNNTLVQVIESPSSLQLQLNQKIIQSSSLQNESQNTSYPTQNDIIYMPSQQKLKDYKLFYESQNLYSTSQLSLQFQGLNFRHEIMMDLSNTQCTVTKNIINLTNYEVIKQQNPPLTIEFDTVTNSYNFENVSLVFDPYTHKDYALQLLIKCDSIKDSNYEYLLNVRTFPCQMGEYYFNEGCFMCDYEKGYYSVKKNSTVCYQADINKVQSNTANMLQIQPGYWRANYHTNDIVSCGTMQQYCLGGWKVDHELCFIGHIGALCEECDIYNKYGNGQFFKGTSHNCLLCEESWGPIISLALLSAWTFISISLTVRSMKLANLQYRNLILGHKHFAIIAKYNQDLAGCLIKMLSNQLLVLAAVYQFQQGISFNLFWIEDIASPSLSASFNFDCWLSQQTIIDILYLRTFLILLIPFLYLNLFIWGYLLYIIYKKEKYESSTIYIVIVYLFVVSQPDTIKYNGALITSRNISGEDWVQANVSYLYDTITHHHWMLYAILPILLTWCAIIPLYFATNLYLNRTKLRYTSFRAKWSYLYNEYVPKRYFWEIVKVLQRELQILILTLFFDNIQIKVYLLFFIQFFYLLTITKMQPFNSEQLNRLEIESVQKCILILIFGLTSWSTSNSNLYVINILSYSLLLFTTIVHVAPFLYNILKIYLKKYEENLDSLINIIQSKPILKRFFSRYLGSIIRNKERKKVVKERFDKIKQYLKTRAKSIKQLEKSIYPQDEQFDNQLVLKSSQRVNSKKLLYDDL